MPSSLQGVASCTTSCGYSSKNVPFIKQLPSVSASPSVGVILGWLKHKIPHFAKSCANVEMLHVQRVAITVPTCNSSMRQSSKHPPNHTGKEQTNKPIGHDDTYCKRCSQYTVWVSARVKPGETILARRVCKGCQTTHNTPGTSPIHVCRKVLLHLLHIECNIRQGLWGECPAPHGGGAWLLGQHYI